MIYVFAAIGAITVIVLMWRAFGPAGEPLATWRSRRTTVPPDDDPEFLRRIAEEQRKPGNPGDES